MNRQTALFVLALLAVVFEMATAAEGSGAKEEKKAESTTASGVATYSALGAIVTAVLANFF
ncbi:hypothetical protein CAEBREN_10781 [Caenorhabditis brenneri]|uniref:Uncharacterized protein n=1 Tax=Caenorhabditis brenneri TaxID=135651 RepID=G0MIK3_CAEBE|nr:hypothetical protein CAEBREN_10781 [Caenorhabditis brenneri]